MRVLIVSAYPPGSCPRSQPRPPYQRASGRSRTRCPRPVQEGSLAVGTRPNIIVHPVIADWTWSDIPRVVRCLRRSSPDVVLLIYIGWVYNHQPMITFLPTICKVALPGVPCVTQFEIVEGRTRRRSLSARVMRKAAALVAGGKDVHGLFGTLLRDSARVIALSGPHRTRLVAQDPAVEEKSAILPPPPLIRICGDDPVKTRRRVREAIGAAANDFVVVYWGYIPGQGCGDPPGGVSDDMRSPSEHAPAHRWREPGGPHRGDPLQRLLSSGPPAPGKAGYRRAGRLDWPLYLGQRCRISGICTPRISRVLPFDYG